MGKGGLTAIGPHCPHDASARGGQEVFRVRRAWQRILYIRKWGRELFGVDRYFRRLATRYRFPPRLVNNKEVYASDLPFPP